MKNPALLDAVVVAAGIVLVAVGAGLYDVRLGLMVGGGLLLVAELAGALLPHGRG